MAHMLLFNIKDSLTNTCSKNYIFSQVLEVVSVPLSGLGCLDLVAAHLEQSPSLFLTLTPDKRHGCSLG